MLANLNSLNNKSGLNKKSLINNTAFEGYSTDQTPMIESSPFLNNLFDIFWNNVAYLSNPFLLKTEKDESICSKEKLLEMLRGFNQILLYFKNNPIDEEDPIIRRFPKYIKDINLFVYQINEPYFRKALLIQLKFLLFNVENQLKVSGKQFEPFSETEMKEVKSIEDLLCFLLRGFKPIEDKPKRNLNEVINKLLLSEKDWMKWKDDGCNPFSKHLTAEEYSKLETSQPLVNTTELDQLVSEKQRDIRSWLNLDKQFDHMMALNRDYLSVELHDPRFQQSHLKYR